MSTTFKSSGHDFPQLYQVGQAVQACLLPSVPAGFLPLCCAVHLPSANPCTCQPGIPAHAFQQESELRRQNEAHMEELAEQGRKTTEPLRCAGEVGTAGGDRLYVMLAAGWGSVTNNPLPGCSPIPIQLLLLPLLQPDGHLRHLAEHPAQGAAPQVPPHLLEVPQLQCARSRAGWRWWCMVAQLGPAFLACV